MQTKDFSDKLLENCVPASQQLAQTEFITFEGDQETALKVLFVGNSITRHAPNHMLGWYGDWGMAASAKEKDYVHIVMRELRDKYRKVAFCTAQCAEWERNYWDDSTLAMYQAARDFRADIVIIRLGENVNRNMLLKYPFKPCFREMIRFFNSNSVSRVFVTSLFWQAEAIDKPIRELAEENGYSLIDLRDLGQKDEMMALGLFENRGVAIHPGDLGMEKIAERVVDSITSGLGRLY